MFFIKKRNLQIFSLIAVCTFLLFGTLHSQTSDELKGTIDSLSLKIKALDAEIKEYNDKINTTQGEAKSLKEALSKLELQRASLSKEIQKTRLELSKTEMNLNNTKSEITNTEYTLNKNKKALSNNLKSMIYDSDKNTSLFFVLEQNSFLSDILDSIKNSADMSLAINDKLLELKNTKNKLNEQKNIFESNKKILVNLNEQLEDQKVLVEQNKNQKNNLLKETKNKESEYKRLLSERQKKRGELEKEMLDVESKLKVIVDKSKIPRYGTGVLQYPIANVKITQYFGNTPFSSKNPQVYNGAGHNGVDFAAKIGTPILASLQGTVLGTGDTDLACSGVSYGKWVLIRHDNGLTTLYAHLSVIQTSSGQRVETGEKIGLSGNTGYSTGPHLHFTVYASDSVHISGPMEYKSKVCGTYMIMPLAPRDGYLNPLSYF